MMQNFLTSLIKDQYTTVQSYVNDSKVFFSYDFLYALSLSSLKNYRDTDNRSVVSHGSSKKGSEYIPYDFRKSNNLSLLKSHGLSSL